MDPVIINLEIPYTTGDLGGLADGSKDCPILYKTETHYEFRSRRRICVKRMLQIQPEEHLSLKKPQNQKTQIDSFERLPPLSCKNLSTLSTKRP